MRAVSRSGTGTPAGVDVVAADATDAARMTEICAGAACVYHCALPPMDSWLPTYVDLTRSLITAAGNVGARLVYADDTWMYGKVDGPMREDSPSPRSDELPDSTVHASSHRSVQGFSPLG